MGLGTGSSREHSYGSSRRRGGPGVVSASERAASSPAPSRGRERCSRTPDPRGKPTCSERPGQGSRVTGDRPSGCCPSQGRAALRTAAAEGQESVRPGHSWRPAPSARLAELRNANPPQPQRFRSRACLTCRVIAQFWRPGPVHSSLFYLSQAPRLACE